MLPMLETERMMIHQITDQDASFIFDLMNSKGWLHYIGDRDIHSLKDAKNYINDMIRPSYQENGFGLLKLEDKNTLKGLGICGLLQRDYLPYPDLGFAVLPAYYRQGYTFEASHGILKYAKEHLKLETIGAITVPENSPSINVLFKLGFQKSTTIARSGEKLLVLKKKL